MSKKKELTEQEQLFLHYLVTDAQGNFKSALAMAGYSEHVKVKDIINRLKDDIIEAAKDIAALNAPKAVLTTILALDGGDAGTGNKLKAAQMILDRVGVSPKAEGVDLKIPSGGLVIMPAKEYKPNENEDS